MTYNSTTSECFINPSDIRTLFSTALSDMYRKEVPAYGELLEIAAQVNSQFNCQVNRQSASHNNDMAHPDLTRLTRERHGAIRVGSARELSSIARLFAVMGMKAVGYYDLSVAGLPIHSTAFRPVQHDDLEVNPFRVFTSLLRLSLIEDSDLRAAAATLIESRDIVSSEAISLIAKCEREGGLRSADVSLFVESALETFRWHETALCDYELYQKLRATHGLIADIVCFKGPHINHLTPRVLDIDMAHKHMIAVAQNGGDVIAKSNIEGPPQRHCPILLRQTSFKALAEVVKFPNKTQGEGGGCYIEATHTARFGEIEQRGAALTRKGRALYDRCLAAGEGAFGAFPDDWTQLYDEGLIYVCYGLTEKGLLYEQNTARVTGPCAADTNLNQSLLAAYLSEGLMTYTPIIYEDFLPVSAAGIFRSNLDLGAAPNMPHRALGGEDLSKIHSESQCELEAAIGSPVLDPFALYEGIQAQSLSVCLAALRDQGR